MCDFKRRFRYIPSVRVMNHSIDTVPFGEIGRVGVIIGEIGSVLRTLQGNSKMSSEHFCSVSTRGSTFGSVVGEVMSSPCKLSDSSSDWFMGASFPGWDPDSFRCLARAFWNHTCNTRFERSISLESLFKVYESGFLSTSNKSFMACNWLFLNEVRILFGFPFLLSGRPSEDNKGRPSVDVRPVWSLSFSLSLLAAEDREETDKDRSCNRTPHSVVIFVNSHFGLLTTPSLLLSSWLKSEE